MLITTFEQLFDVGTKMEDALRDGKIKKEESNPRTKPIGGNSLNKHTTTPDAIILNQSPGKTSNPNL